jgi:hypothetical protein
MVNWRPRHRGVYLCFPSRQHKMHHWLYVGLRRPQDIRDCLRAGYILANRPTTGRG